MLSPAEIAAKHTARLFRAGETLITQGLEGGDLYVLTEGRLGVERDGVRIATISNPGAVIGEMAVVLGTASTATVKAETDVRVQVIADARQVLQADPALTFQIAWLIAQRLDATSAYLVKLSKESAGKPEVGIFGKLLAALHAPTDAEYVAVGRGDLFDKSSGV